MEKYEREKWLRQLGTMHFINSSQPNGKPICWNSKKEYFPAFLTVKKAQNTYKTGKMLTIENFKGINMELKELNSPHILQ